METSHKQTLPEKFSMTTFERNLAALAHVDEALAQRLCLPVNGRHIHFNESKAELTRMVKNNIVPATWQI